MEINILTTILEHLSGAYISVILFGSYGRGDQNEFSDIDVLHVTEMKMPPYSYKNVNYSTYTYEQLLKMAQDGDLFVFHIIMEGKLLFGSIEPYEYLKSQFIKPKNSDSFRIKILNCATLLNVSRVDFLENSMDYYRLLAYLFRSYLYSIMLDEGSILYSIKMLSAEFKGERIEKVFNLKNSKIIDYTDFLFCVAVFKEYSKLNFGNEIMNSLDLLKEFKVHDEFSFRIGLHFLKSYVEDLYS